MLRRAATTGFHCQCLSRLGNSRNPLSSSSFSSSLPKIEGDDAFAEGEKKNSTATTHALSDSGGTARASSNNNNNNNATTPMTRGRTRRSLRPMLIPPYLPSSRLLLPVMSIPETPSSSNDQNQNAETDPSSSSSPSSSSTTTITITGLPPNTLKADIRFVFQRFGEVSRIFVQPDGRRADVVFADVHGVKRTLHAYAEKPLHVRGRDIIVFRNNKVSGMEIDTDAPSRATRTEQGPADSAICVSNLPHAATQEELLKSMEPFGKYEQFVTRPGSTYAYFIYSNEDHVEQILNVHQRVPIIIRGRTLRIERAKNRPYSRPTGSLGVALELRKPLDRSTSSPILKDLTRTVARFKGSHDPSHVLWIGGLPKDISRTALANFWSRLGCVVDVRSSSNGGYAHVEFASTEEGLRAVRKGAPHGFRYRQRLLDIDFAHWEYYVGSVYRAAYISGWPASNGRPALLQWAHDIRNITRAVVLPPFRGETRSDSRGAILQFKAVDDARAALRMLDGRLGPGGETLHVELSRVPAVDPNEMWRWYEVEKSSGGKEEACLEDKWGGLGFATGEEEGYDTRGVEH